MAVDGRAGDAELLRDVLDRMHPATVGAQFVVHAEHPGVTRPTGSFSSGDQVAAELPSPALPVQQVTQTGEPGSLHFARYNQDRR